MKIAIAAADWEDAEELGESFTRALATFGLVVQEIDTLSDTRAFTIARRKLTARQQKAAFRAF